MFRKFLDGLIFGSGFAVAFVFIAYVGLQVIIPAVVNSANKAPEFHNPKTAEVIEQEASTEPKLGSNTGLDRKSVV